MFNASASAPAVGIQLTEVPKVTIPPDVARVMMRAKLGTAGEIAIWGFHMVRVHGVGNTVDWADDTNNIAAATRDAWNAHSTKSAYATSVVMDRVDVYHLGTDGKTIDKGTASFTGEDAWAGTQGVSMPWETSIAVTLYGYDPSGFVAEAANKRGRFYLPPMAQGALGNVDGFLDPSPAATLQTDIGAFLGQVNGLELHDYGELTRDTMALGILSRRRSIFTPVAFYGIDRKFDTQRRRENKQVPFRYIAAVPA